MRIIICGSRDWAYPDIIRDSINLIIQEVGPDVEITWIHGANPHGADQMADEYLRSLGYIPEIYKANWKGYGRAAGPIRNRQMLMSGCDLIVAFKDNFDWSFKRGGTENMVKQAIAAKINNRVVSMRKPETL